MHRLSLKVLLPVLCAVALLCSVLGTVLVSGGVVFPWRDEPNGIEKIIERDGYLEGIWYPWFTHHNLGHGFTTNELMVKYVDNTWADVGFEQYGANSIYQEIYNLKALGFNILGYEGSIYGEGVVYDDYGNVLGIKEEYLKNVRAFLDICREIEMPLLWTICCHSTTVNTYYEDGKYVWDVISQAYANPVVADQYAENFVKPLCRLFAEYPDVVVMIAATSEAENEINDSDLGNHNEGNRAVYGVNQEDMLYFINAVNEMVKQELPDVTRTLCSNQSDMSIYRDIDFDLLGKQEYNYLGRSPVIEKMKPNSSMFISEFGFGDTIHKEDEVYTIQQINFRDNFMAEGFKGWMMWCWTPGSFGGIYDLLAADGTSNTDFRAFAYALHYYVMNYRAAHRGEEIVLDQPVLFCNTGSGKVEWISSRQATKLDLLRSMDGGKTWKAILKGVNPTDYEVNFKGRYEDAEIANYEGDATVMYQLIAYDDEGNRAESAPSNEKPILGPAKNLVYNGSFENGLDGWLDFGDPGVGYRAEALAYEGAEDGRFVLELEYLSKQWQGVHQDAIAVKPDTNYKLTYKYRIAEDVDFMTGYCFVRGLGVNGQGTGLGDIDDHVLGSTYLNVGSSDAWTTDTLIFRTNSSDKLCIDFRVIPGVHYYIDDVQLVELR